MPKFRILHASTWVSSRNCRALCKVQEVHDDGDRLSNLSDPSDVLRQRDRTRALRRQSVMRARRESGSGLEHLHHHQHHDGDAADTSRSDADDGSVDEEEQSQNPVNGVGTGPMRYQYMTPEDFGDDITMGSVDILKAFKGLSSTHGIPHVSDARGLFKVSFWSLMTAAMVVGVCYNLYAITDKFFSYPVSVGIAIQHANDLDFPAVTICNMSPLRASAINESALQLLHSGSSAKRRKKRATTTGLCCCTCCAVTTWLKSVDTCETCLDAGPADAFCPAGGFTTPAPTSTTTLSTTTKKTTIGTTSSTTTSFTTQPPAAPSAYEARPELRGDFKNEEH